MSHEFRFRQSMEQKNDLGLKLKFKIVPQTTCPFCGKVVAPVQKNFMASDTDCRMICDQCQQTFQGLLQIFDTEGIDVATHHFLCPAQTLHAMRELLVDGRKQLGEKFLRTKHPEIYFSALKNFGNYEKARKSL